MGKGQRHREARAARERERAEPMILFHGTAGVTGEYVKTRGMTGAERAGILLVETPELAREHALTCTARLLADGFKDRRGLIVEVTIDPGRVRFEESAPGHWWTSPGVRPHEITGLHYFDASDERADGDRADELADVFDRDSEAWRRAATGEMEG